MNDPVAKLNEATRAFYLALWDFESATEVNVDATTVNVDLLVEKLVNEALAAAHLTVNG